LGLWDFQRDPEGARQAINKWVGGQTQNKIPELFGSGSLDNDTRLVLVNAIYFLSDWRSPFNTQATLNDKFRLTDGTTVSAAFMRQTLEIPYGENEVGQWISLPYAGEHLSMWVFLPAADTTLETCAEAMTADNWEALCADTVQRDVQLSLPKFKFDSSYVLNDTLKQLGIRRAFGLNAEFQRMTSADSLHISLVVHKAFIEVSERGTEAAAATGVAMATASAPVEPRPPVIFNANRPFLFVIRDNLRNQNLFIGRMAQPK
jgi:serpin B